MMPASQDIRAQDIWARVSSAYSEGILHEITKDVGEFQETYTVACITDEVCVFSNCTPGDALWRSSPLLTSFRELFV